MVKLSEKFESYYANQDFGHTDRLWLALIELARQVETIRTELREFKYGKNYKAGTVEKNYKDVKKIKRRIKLNTSN